MSRSCRRCSSPSGVLAANCASESQRAVHVLAQAGEFALPVKDRVAAFRQGHVAQRNGKLVSVVLQAQKLERGLAILLHHVHLEILEPADFADRVGGEDDEDGQRDAQAQPEAPRGRRDFTQKVVFGFGHGRVVACISVYPLPRSLGLFPDNQSGNRALH